jgi:hypothetical protein
VARHTFDWDVNDTGLAMTSAAQRAANRRNAKFSTGPRTAVGKIRASRNALKHGLSIPIASDPQISAEIEALAHKIMGENPVPALLPFARQIADAQLDLNRVRRARHALLLDAHDAPDESPELLKNKARIARLFRKHGIEPGPARSPLRGLVNVFFDLIRKQPRPVQRVAIAFGEMASKLATLDRYERRALSRRKFAVRAYDATRQWVLAERSQSGLGQMVKS